MTDHPNCGTDDCCGNCEPASPDMDTLLPYAAQVMWDNIAQRSPQHIAAWDDQTEQSRDQFTRALALGLEAMAYAAGETT
jgi:hypothetical protein